MIAKFIQHLNVPLRLSILCDGRPAVNTWQYRRATATMGRHLKSARRADQDECTTTSGVAAEAFADDGTVGDPVDGCTHSTRRPTQPATAAWTDGHGATAATTTTAAEPYVARLESSSTRSDATATRHEWYRYGSEQLWRVIQ